MNQIVLEARHINKTFHDPVTIPVLKDISFTINKGEFTSVIGKSGCGKSMTAKALAGIMDPVCDLAGGEIVLNGTDLAALTPKEVEAATDLYASRAAALSAVAATFTSARSFAGFSLAWQAGSKAVRQKARMPMRAARIMDANSGLVSPLMGLVTQYGSGMADRERLIYSKSVKRWSP